MKKEYLKGLYKECGKGLRKLNVYDIWKKDKCVDYSAMLNELARITKLPRFICKIVYDAEEQILANLGLLH